MPSTRPSQEPACANNNSICTVFVLAAPGSGDVPKLPPADHLGGLATDSLCGSHH